MLAVWLSRSFTIPSMLAWSVRDPARKSHLIGFSMTQLFLIIISVGLYSGDVESGVPVAYHAGELVWDKYYRIVNYLSISYQEGTVRLLWYLLHHILQKSVLWGNQSSLPTPWHIWCLGSYWDMSDSVHHYYFMTVTVRQLVMEINICWSLWRKNTRHSSGLFNLIKYIGEKKLEIMETCVICADWN